MHVDTIQRKAGLDMLIREFQNMMRLIYFQRDSDRGPTGTYSWLKEEVDELGAAMKKGDKKTLADEFADVIAWLASLANVMNVDLEEAAINKYNNSCPRCGLTPCECPFVVKKS